MATTSAPAFELVVPLRRRARVRVRLEGLTWRVELTRPRLPKESGPAWPVFTHVSQSLEFSIDQAFQRAGVDWDVRQLARYIAHRQGNPAAW